MGLKQGTTTRDGERVGYYQWKGGKKYTYEQGDKRSRERAKKKAKKQGRAIEASKRG